MVPSALCLACGQSQAPQHLRSCASDCFVRQFTSSVISLDSSVSRTAQLSHPLSGPIPISTFTFYIKPIESVTMMACVVGLSLLDAAQQRARATASQSTVKRGARGGGRTLLYSESPSRLVV